MSRHRDRKTEELANAMREAIRGNANSYERLLCIGVDTQHHAHVRCVPMDIDMSVLYATIAKLLAYDAARRKLSRQEMLSTMQLMLTMADGFYEAGVAMQEA